MNTECAIDFQISLEKRIGRIYRKIADQFPCETEEDVEWIAFWKGLSSDEKDHAALLVIEKRFLQSGTRIERPIAIGSEMQEVFDTLLTKCEDLVHAGITQGEAIEILEALESSEVNETFGSLLKATDSKVLNHLANFSRAHALHDYHIQEAIQKYGHSASSARI